MIILTKSLSLAPRIQTVTVKTIARAADILSDPSKYEPQSKETADHSLPYCLAAACARAKVTPEEFTEASIHDPAIRSFLPKIKVTAEPEYEALFPDKQPNLITIETTTGESFEEYVEFPRGHCKMPLEKLDLLQKFAALAAPEMDEARVEKVYDLIMEFDSLDTMAPFFEAIRIR